MELRKSKGLSQSEFAKQLGQGRGTVFNWESARNKPDDEAPLAVCRILGTSASYLLGETDDPRPAPVWYGDEGGAARTARALQLMEEAARVLRGET